MVGMSGHKIRPGIHGLMDRRWKESRLGICTQGTIQNFKTLPSSSPAAKRRVGFAPFTNRGTGHVHSVSYSEQLLG
jgi:hypothetical protein